MKRRADAALGAAAIAGFAIHGSTHIRLGTPEGMLWMCNMGALLVGAGLILGQARAVAIGFSWLVVGDVIWGLDLLGGSSLLPTSLLTHIVGLGVAILGLRRIGFPARTWPNAVLALAALQALTRLVAPARSNVNVANAIYPGADRIFSSYPAYWAALLAASVVLFGVVELVASRIFPPGQPRADKEH